MSMAMNPLTGEDSAEEFKLTDDCETEATQTNVPSSDVPSTATQETLLASFKPEPRLCHLKKWPHFQGYGFNLHAERAKTGQHIGKVDVDSPAESAGLREGDRIIEVNCVNISNENHQQVVKRIRNGLERNGKFYDNEVSFFSFLFFYFHRSALDSLFRSWKRFKVRYFWVFLSSPKSTQI